MSAQADCQLVGRWRIVEADLWDRDHLDLCGPAAITIGAEGRGEIAFGAMEAALETAYGRTSIDFNWIGFDEGDDVSGEGSAELLDDGSIEIKFAYHNGDEAVLKAKREPFSAPCTDCTLEVAAKEVCAKPKRLFCVIRSIISIVSVIVVVSDRHFLRVSEAIRKAKKSLKTIFVRLSAPSQGS